MIRALLFLGSLALTLVSSNSWAQEVTAENKAAARELAVSGIRRAQEGDCEGALEQLQRAEALFHAPTILTWIGQCEIELGRYVAGTETLRRVVRESLPSDAPAAYIDAQDKAQTLLERSQPKIARLTIHVTGPEGDLSGTGGLEVFVDESPVAAPLIGAPRPTDPGVRQVTARLEGFRTASAMVTLAEGGQETLELVLQPADDVRSTSDDATFNDSKSGGPRRTVGWLLVGAGAAALAGGGVMGVLAMSEKNQLNCTNKSCPETESEGLNAAKRNALVSTVLLGVGGALTVGGVLVIVTKKRAPQEVATWRFELGQGSRARRVEMTPTLGWGRLGVQGSF